MNKPNHFTTRRKDYGTGAPVRDPSAFYFLMSIKLRKRTAQQIIAEHYGVPLSRVDPQTEAEELASMIRKYHRGSLDSHDEHLYSALSIHGHIPDQGLPEWTRKP